MTYKKATSYKIWNVNKRNHSGFRYRILLDLDNLAAKRDILNINNRRTFSERIAPVFCCLLSTTFRGLKLCESILSR